MSGQGPACSRCQAAIIFSFVIGIAQGTSASGFCQSTSGLDVVPPHCIREPQIEIDLQLSIERYTFFRNAIR